MTLISIYIIYNNIDINGYFVIGLAIIAGLLITGAVAGGVVAGVTAAENGETGWDLAKSIIIGASLGIAASGFIIGLTGIGIGAFNPVILGLEATRFAAIGFLAVDIIAFGILPIFGIAMQGIEFALNNYYQNNSSNSYQQSTSLKSNNSINFNNYNYRLNKWKMLNI